jgi:hypothetical protein
MDSRIGRRIDGKSLLQTYKWGARKGVGDNLEVVWAKFLTLS